MGDLTIVVSAPVTATLAGSYAPRSARLDTLYEQAQQGQWNPTTVVDWSAPTGFGAPLPYTSDYSLAAFTTSPLAHHGQPAWDTFRWELHAWLVSQFLHGEQGALVAAARLVEVLPDIDAKCCMASQVADEARHVQVFSRYCREKLPHTYAISPPLGSLLTDILKDARWDMIALGMQLIVEPLALAAFRLAPSTLHDELIKQLTHLVARDEARHVSLGLTLLDGIYDAMTNSERACREEFVLEAIVLMSRRFLLADIWERMEVPLEEGIAWAATNETMIAYRQALFSKLVSNLTRLGLVTQRIRDCLAEKSLLGPSAARAIANSIGARCTR